LNRTLESLRRLLLALLAIGLVGTGADLVLLQHYEDVWQIVPLALVAIGLVVIGWMTWTRVPQAIVAVRITMALFLGAGALGFVLHYRSNHEFQKEIDPSLDGWKLAVAVMRAKAPPALAPASMIQLGLLGLLCTYRHPSVAATEPFKGADV
jgi:hypothetical protein